MGKYERIAIWIALAALAIYAGAMTAVFWGELGEINAQLAALIGDQLGHLAPPGLEQAETPGVRVGIAGVRALTDTLALTVTVSAYGAGDLLFEPPVLQDGAGRSYPLVASSLEQARLAFLDLVTRSQASVRLEFAGAPGRKGLWLVFNPGQRPDSPVAPRVRVAVPGG